MKKILKIIGILVLAIIVVAFTAFGVFWYRNVHWFDKYETALAKVSAEEKQVTLPSGIVINYGEVVNDKPALLMIHGQGGIWESYATLMPELSRNWHIYAIDVYGHGGSSHDESLYYLNVNGDDLIWFIDHVIGEKIGISRQAYAKWETGATVPDIEKCMRLAETYGVTIDSLVATTTLDEGETIVPPPKRKNIWGSVTINERGQLVIPKNVREMFGLSGGQRLIVLTDDKEGIALVPAKVFEDNMKHAMEFAERKPEE